MDYSHRDTGINHIRTRKKHPRYGMGLGIIILDDPCANYTLVWKEDKSLCLEPIKRAAKRLEQIWPCLTGLGDCGCCVYTE